MTKPDSSTPCGVCRGAYKEHFDDKDNPITQHAFVPEGGPLLTQQEAAEARKPAPTPILNPAMLQYMGNAGLSAGRLTEMLMQKGVITDQEALYIAGILPKNPAVE